MFKGVRATCLRRVKPAAPLPWWIAFPPVSNTLRERLRVERQVRTPTFKVRLAIAQQGLNARLVDFARDQARHSLDRCQPPMQLRCAVLAVLRVRRGLARARFIH